MCGRNFPLEVLVRFGTLQAAECRFELAPGGGFGWLACSFLPTFQFHNLLLAGGFILIRPRISFLLPSIFSWFALAVRPFRFWKVNATILLCHVLPVSPVFFSSGIFGIFYDLFWRRKLRLSQPVKCHIKAESCPCPNPSFSLASLIRFTTDVGTSLRQFWSPFRLQPNVVCHQGQLYVKSVLRSVRTIP